MAQITDFEPAIEELSKELALIEEKVMTGYTLADAMREGCTVTRAYEGWGKGTSACALSAAAIGARARGIV